MLPPRIELEESFRDRVLIGQRSVEWQPGPVGESLLAPQNSLGSFAPDRFVWSNPGVVI